jgi:hypothetical protein
MSHEECGYSPRTSKCNAACVARPPFWLSHYCCSLLLCSSCIMAPVERDICLITIINTFYASCGGVFPAWPIRHRRRHRRYSRQKASLLLAQRHSYDIHNASWMPSLRAHRFPVLTSNPAHTSTNLYTAGHIASALPSSTVQAPCIGI